MVRFIEHRALPTTHAQYSKHPDKPRPSHPIFRAKPKILLLSVAFNRFQRCNTRWTKSLKKLFSWKHKKKRHFRHPHGTSGPFFPLSLSFVLIEGSSHTFL
jgi:hypothetical protein